MPHGEFNPGLKTVGEVNVFNGENVSVFVDEVNNFVGIRDSDNVFILNPEESKMLLAILSDANKRFA